MLEPECTKMYQAVFHGRMGFQPLPSPGFSHFLIGFRQTPQSAELDLRPGAATMRRRSVAKAGSVVGQFSLYLIYLGEL